MTNLLHFDRTYESLGLDCQNRTVDLGENPLCRVADEEAGYPYTTDCAHDDEVNMSSFHLGRDDFVGLAFQQMNAEFGTPLGIWFGELLKAPHMSFADVFNQPTNRWLSDS